MISKEEIQNLAELARLKLREEEVAPLQKDISAILEYVGQISAVSPAGKDAPALHTVMRADEVQPPRESVRQQLLAAAPRREGDYVVVRKVIEKDE